MNIRKNRVEIIDWQDESSPQVLAAKKRVHKASDEWGDILVLDYFNHRVMTFDSIYEQSRMDKTQPFVPVHEYTKAMLLIMAFIRPQRVTLLGLGAAALLRALHQLNPVLDIRAVELRQKVVTVARDYFGLPQADNVKVMVADAAQYMNEKPQATTDIIFADLYQAYDMAAFQAQPWFLQQCHRALTENGWLVMNFHEMPNANSAFMLRLKKLFPEVLVCLVPKGNYIIYAGKVRCEKLLGDYFEELPRLETALHTLLGSLYRRLSRLEDAEWYKRKPGSNFLGNKNHFTDADYPPLDD